MISPNTYEEVYEILSFMDKLTVMKIPEEILRTINKRRNPKFKTRIDKNDIFNKNNMSEEALNLLCYIDYNYWMDKNRKSEIDKILRVREKEIEHEKREKYNPDDLFKNNEKITEQTNKCKKNSTLIPIKENFFTKFMKKIKF